jgi:hypothetical protein
MAAIALAALASGFLTGAAKRITGEREESEELIQNRLKMAVLNKKASDEKKAARRDELQQRLEMVSPFFQSTGNPEMDEKLKLGLISSPLIAKQFAEQAQNEVVDPQKFLRLRADKIPKNFTSVKDFIASVGEVSEPVAPDQMQGMLSRTGFLGREVGVSPERADRLARSLGAGSAAELLPYENREPVDTTSLMELATINVDLYPAKLKTPKEQAEHIQSKIVQYELTGNTAEADNAKIELGRLEAVLATMTPEEASWSERRNKLQAVVASDRSTPEAKNKALAEIRRGDAVGPPLSPDLLLKTATLAGTAALEKVYGELIGQGITLLTAADGTTSFQVIPGTKAEKQQEDIRKTYEEGVRSVLRLVVDPVTQLPNPAYEAVFKAFAMGFKPKEAPPAPSPPPPAPPRAGVMSRPEAVTTPAEAARPAQVAPAAPPKRTMSQQDAQAAAWVKQNPNDPRAAAIRETLERKYGK